MYKRHPHGHGGDKEHYKQAGNGKCKDRFGREESPNPSRSHAKMDFSLLRSVGNNSLSVQSFPISGSPSCSWWIRDVQQIVPTPWRPWQVVLLEAPGWEGSPAPAGILLQRRASLRQRLLPSPHTCFSTLWLQLSQLILVGQPLEGCPCVPGAVPDGRGRCQS